MEWSDQGIILTTRPHGETSVIVSLLTAQHGRHAGLVAQGMSARVAPSIQIGNHVEVVWAARLLDQLGTYRLEVLSSPAALCFDDPEKLSIMASATALTEIALPERQPLQGVYEGLLTLLHLEDARLWGAVYVKWEMELLRALGYGLDLSACAVTGETEGLAFVSPRTGRAVTKDAGKAFAPRLLALPRFLCGAMDWDDRDILDGLELMGHFLERSILAHQHRQLYAPQLGGKPPSPFLPARERLVAFYRRRCEG